MFKFHRVLLAIIISCSLGAMSTYSTTASAAMRHNKDVVKDVVESLTKALAAIEADESKEVILGHIQNSRQFSKEINVGSLGAIVDRGADAIISIRRNVKAGDKDASMESTYRAIKIYQDMGKKTL